MADKIEQFKLCITFDVDFTDYGNHGTLRDEFEVIDDIILPYLDLNQIPATWFIRLDKKIEYDFGAPDYLFIKYKSTIDKFLSLGHYIGWHPHCYTFQDGKWIQNTDEKSVLKELKYLLPYAKEHNLDIVRMGWGYQTNKTMQFFDAHDFLIDSSCIARPKYKWESTIKDWEVSTNRPYHPSKNDYRVSGYDRLKILEVPITTVYMPVDTDTERVKRYINLSFYNRILSKPTEEWIKNANFMVTITHPYELSSGLEHSVISFGMDEFEKNLDFIKRVCSSVGKAVVFKTLKSAFVREYND